MDMLEKLKRLKGFSHAINEDKQQIALKILEAAAALAPLYTLEELHDFVFFLEVPKRLITPERDETYLWSFVKDQWGYSRSNCELAELLVSQPFQELLRSGN